MKSFGIFLLFFNEVVLTSTYNLRFRAKIRKIIHTPVILSFSIIQKWGLRGSLLHGCVSMIAIKRD